MFEGFTQRKHENSPALSGVAYAQLCLDNGSLARLKTPLIFDSLPHIDLTRRFPHQPFSAHQGEGCMLARQLE